MANPPIPTNPNPIPTQSQPRPHTITTRHEMLKMNVPEIQRTNLSNVVLLLKSLKVRARPPAGAGWWRWRQHVRGATRSCSAWAPALLLATSTTPSGRAPSSLAPPPWPSWAASPAPAAPHGVVVAHYFSLSLVCVPHPTLALYRIRPVTPAPVPQPCRRWTTCWTLASWTLPRATTSSTPCTACGRSRRSTTRVGGCWVAVGVWDGMRTLTALDNTGVGVLGCPGFVPGITVP